MSCAARPAHPRPLPYERHRPEQTTLYRLVQQHAAHFIAHTEASTGAALPRFIKDEFEAFLECGILAHGFLRLRCARHLLGHTGLRSDEGQGGAVTLIQRFGSAANLNIHLHCLVLDGVYRCGADGSPAFIEADAPTDDELDALLHTIIARLMRMLTRRGVLVEDMGQTYLAELSQGRARLQSVRLTPCATHLRAIHQLARSLAIHKWATLPPCPTPYSPMPYWSFTSP